MPYLLKKTKVRDKVYIEKAYSSRYGRNTVPGPKEKQTPERLKKQHQKERIKKLNWLIEENFEIGDYHLTLTFSKENRTCDKEKLQNIMKEFMKDLRKIYKKAGQELKYIKVTEKKKSCVHFHMIINSIPDLHKVLPKIWKKGRMYMEPLFESECGFEQLASYLIKEKGTGEKETGERSYTHSRNLVVPETKVTVIRSVKWTQQPKAPKVYLSHSLLSLHCFSSPGVKRRPVFSFRSMPTEIGS